METEKHFKLREDMSTALWGVKLCRIEATKDLEHHGVKAGDLGGFVETYDNLSENAWVSDNAAVCGNAKVLGNALVSGSAWVGGYARVFGNAQVHGRARVSGNSMVFGNARVYGDALLSENAQVYGDAQVLGLVHLSSNVRVCCDKIDSPWCWRHIVNEKYPITILPEYIQIGCRSHLKKEWWGFSDDEILAMDGKAGLKWWKKWKPILKAMCSY